MIKLLTFDDAEDIFEIINSHQSISKIPFLELKEEFLEKIKLTFQNPNVRCIGYYENDCLTTFLIQQLSDKIPAWHMTLLGTRSIHRWNYSLNGLDLCWSNAMSFAEEKGIFRLYWALPERWARTQNKTILTSTTWPRYDIYIEAIVPANQYPVWLEYRPSFGEKLKPHNTVIKLGVLKNEYRKLN